MQTATFSEFRRQTKYYLDAVRDGATVRILRHGRPIADVVPAIDSAAALPAWKRPGSRLALRRVSLARTIIAERRSAKR